MRSFHSMVKCGSTILFRAGRFSQIWKSSSGLGSVALSSGNISECWMPPARRDPLHIAPPKRAAAQRIGMVDEPLAHQRHRFKAAVRVAWKAGHGLAVVHAPAVLAAEVATDLAAFQRHGGRKGAIACG